MTEPGLPVGWDEDGVASTARAAAAEPSASLGASLRETLQAVRTWANTHIDEPTADPYGRLDRTDLAVASDCWAATVVAAGGGDAEQTMQGRATLVNQRLNRTAPATWSTT